MTVRSWATKASRKSRPSLCQAFDNDLFALAVKADGRLDGLYVVECLLGSGGFGR